MKQRKSGRVEADGAKVLAGRLGQPWGDRTPYARGAQWPVRVDLQLADGVGVEDVERWVPSASVLHSNGDAFDIAVRGDRIVGVRGRGHDRVNRGRLDPKDLLGWQATASPDRLSTPLLRADGRLVPVDWDTAMDRIVSRTRELLSGPGPDAIGFYTSGQLFLEEYYTLATIARGGIGTNHLDGNTRLCTATAGESLEESFGCDGQPVCGIDAETLRRAAHMLGTAEYLVSTVLQGFYQSHQATAAAVQVDNIHLLRGMLGAPGRGVLQMNGQPTAQNTRECGANGDLPGFRNWANRAHIEELARLWNVDPDTLDHDGPPTDAMKMIRLAETGQLRMLWVSATNPAVSLPDLARIRRILGADSLFLIVQDIFPTETTELADVVLPAAAWGEKTGAFTNADRTVHLSERAVSPPGAARSDLAIFLDFARRLDLRDRDGSPLPPWTDEEGAFAAWQRCSAGRPCDYTGLSYAALRQQGIQWPCATGNSVGVERLYRDGRFFADPDTCETFGKDLCTGDPIGEDEYRAWNPDGRAMLKPAPYLEPAEAPSPHYPLALITGRTIYHFHTRTKTGRVPRLREAAPEVWVEISEVDAGAYRIRDGDRVRVKTRRGSVEARARLTAIRPGVVFIPFHYGYWDAGDRAHTRAANELTPTEWDPVSKQPLFKSGAARLTKITE
ncbi:molybdopterin oxidoreductase family protein [Nocardia sp. NPDC003693]